MENASPAARTSKLLMLLLLLLYWVMAVTAAKDKSITFDETTHLVAGYTSWVLNDFRMYGDGGFLAQRLAALPLLAIHPRLPSLDQPDWRKSNIWSYPYQFLFRVGNDVDTMVLLGRSVCGFLGVALGYLIFFLSRHYFGSRAALLSLMLYVFCPSFLAHGALITGDIALTFFLLLSVWMLWQLLHEISLMRILIFAFCLACLFLSKVSALIILPLGLLLFLIHLLKSRDLIVRVVPPLAIAFLIAIGFIWFNFGFRFSAFHEPTQSDQLYVSWDTLSHEMGRPATYLLWVKEKKLLPEIFLYGIAYHLKAQQGRRAFLLGQYSVSGWWYFFPYAFLVKTPLPSLILMATGILAIFCRKRDSLYDLTALFALLVVYFIFALTSRINLGHRHILPIYPCLFVFAGANVFWIQAKRYKTWLIIAALFWTIVESFSVRPHYLAYFNQLAGGPENGYRHLVDSSLDWGQDLPTLKDWVDRNDWKGGQVYLSYFGTADPSYYGLEAIRLPSYADQRRDADRKATWRGGLYCISATMLASVYTPVIGLWSAPYEATYQELLRKQPLEESEHDFFVRLQFARLCAFLRHRKPDAQAGYSILIYRLNDADLQAALFGKPVELESGLNIRGLRE